MKMKFLLKHAGSGAERTGTLTNFPRSPGAVIETPTAALFTRGGSVAHLTADVLARVFSTPQLLWMPLANSRQLETGVKVQGEGVAKFAGLSGHIACMTLHDITDLTPTGHFEKDLVPLWTRYGKEMIYANRYMDMMESFKPDIILAIADARLQMDVGMKRHSKSVQRTCELFDVCIKRYKTSAQLQESALIGVLVGGSNIQQREKCMEHILAQGDSLTGVALGGVTEGGSACMQMATDKLEAILEDVGRTLSPGLVRIIEGCWNPAVTMAAIAHGWDVFDGSYPTELTSSGRALALNFDLSQTSNELCILDLNDKRYKEEFQPILSGCECLTCSQHTRAYINHLLVTKEMLALVLLTIHNLHHFDQMFRHVRKHITLNTFHKFREYITQQYELYKSNEPETEEPKFTVDVVEDNTKKTKINNAE